MNAHRKALVLVEDRTLEQRALDGDLGGLPPDKLAAVYREALDVAMRQGLWGKARALRARLNTLTAKPEDRDTLPSRDGPPPGLSEFEATVMASKAPAVITIDRATMRELLRYIRRLERDRLELGSFY